MTRRNCSELNCKDKDGNCSMPSSDGLPVQCVGTWVEDKFFFLERYLNASCEARRKFSDKGNAVFIDLFAGPGKCIIKGKEKEIDSGGIRALNRNDASFNNYYYFDIMQANVDALQQRIEKNFGVHIKCGDSNILVDDLVQELLKHHYRYHFAFIDPFSPQALKFDTLKRLAKLIRMDMLINFPIGAIKRNLKTWMNRSDTILDDFLGTGEWRQEIKESTRDNTFRVLIEIYKKQLISIGYPKEGLRAASSDNEIYSGLPTVSIRNTKDVDLYVLILASKHPLGQKIWNSSIKYSPDGQKGLF